MFKALQEQLLRRSKRRAFARQCEAMSDNAVAQRLRAAGDGFLVSQEWKTLRACVLDRYGWSCMRCGVVPSKRASVNVDHIKPRKYFPELALEFDNLQVLCKRCNKAKGNGAAIDYRPR